LHKYIILTVMFKEMINAGNNTTIAGMIHRLPASTGTALI